LALVGESDSANRSPPFDPQACPIGGEPSSGTITFGAGTCAGERQMRRARHDITIVFQADDAANLLHVIESRSAKS
jgi:hypothetical protein